MQAFDNLLHETLTIKLIIGQNTFLNPICFQEHIGAQVLGYGIG